MMLSRNSTFGQIRKGGKETVIPNISADKVNTIEDARNVLSGMTRDDVKIDSAKVEDTFQYLLTRWVLLCEIEARDYGIGSFEHLDALEALWFGVNGLQRVCVASTTGFNDSAVHASVAVGNNMGEVATYIECKIGFNPSLNQDKPFKYNPEKARKAQERYSK
jgi:hypothetical protein